MTHTRTQMTDFEKGRVLAYAKTLNAAKIAKELGRDPSTIRRFLAKYKKTGKSENLPRSGRPRVLGDQDKSLLIHEVTEKRHAPLREIVNNLGFTCSLSTIKNALYDSGLYSHVAAKKPYTSEKHACARVEWCKKHKDLSIYEWRKVIFSDEACVEIGKQSRQLRVWRYTGERFNLNCLAPTFKVGRRSVMIWACFAGEVKGSLVFCDENKEKEKKNITAISYLDILKKHLLPFKLIVRELTKKNAVFQHDNAPIHTAKIVKEWFKEEGIKVIDWPANSPDLNPIENVWKLLKDNIQRREVFPKTKEELKIALEEEWQKFDTSILNGIIDSMPRRIKAVLKVNGGPTKY